MSISQAIMPSAISFALPVGIILCIGGSLDLSRLIVCIILSLAIVGALQKVMEFMENIVTINEVQGRVQQLIDMDELPQAQKGESPHSYDISLADVRFTYDKAEVLRGISFDAKAGTTTALVGPSGSGKSTLAKLIARFWDVGEGSVKIGGVDIRNIPLDELMDKLSYVSQDNFLFNMSLRDNIRVGKPDASDGEIERIAELAGCGEFISRFADGYATNAGDAGERLSGGERQRIAIARAMIKGAPIVILDEATAFTDPESEDKLQRSIDALTKGKTLVVIAHRLSTVMYADNISVLNGGSISDQGTHEELLARSALYQSMWRAHTRAMDWNMKGEAGTECGA
jgi:ABC-type multidrug transport system fused ATPase/permease subunit